MHDINCETEGKELGQAREALGRTRETHQPRCKFHACKDNPPSTLSAHKKSGKHETTKAEVEK